MYRIVSVVLSAALAVLSSCSHGSSGTGDATGPDSAASETAEGKIDLPPLLPEWEAVPGATLDTIKAVKGFACGNGSLFLDMDGLTTEGLFVKNAADDSGFTQLFTGVGLVAVTAGGALVAQYGGQNQTSSLTLVAADGTATDQAYNFEQTEIRILQLQGNFILTLSKDWTAAEYMIHRGSLAVPGGYEQAGTRLNETAMSMHATEDTVYVLTQMNAYSGTNCWRIPITSGPEVTWEKCPQFPAFVKYKEGQPFSVKAVVFGKDERLALWFKVNNKGEETFRHYLSQDGASWAEAGGFPELLPSAQHHEGDYYFVGYTDQDADQSLYRMAADGSGQAQAYGAGLPDAAEKSGVIGFCPLDGVLHAAWLDFDLAGSTVTIYRLPGD